MRRLLLGRFVRTAWEDADKDRGRMPTKFYVVRKRAARRREERRWRAAEEQPRT